MNKRIKVGLLFGGQSGEHEVSLASARSVLAALDRTKFEAVGIGITRQGRWLMSSSPENMLQQEVTDQLQDAREIVPDIAHHSLVVTDGAHHVADGISVVDVVFPLLHGPYGEDGTVQGMLSLAHIPFVGSETLGSALSMDKGTMKAMFAHAGLPQVRYELVSRQRWQQLAESTVQILEASLDYPMFVKPCNLGSSVGISKAHDRDALEIALDLAARYDRRILVEQGIDAREVECGILGNDEPMVSVPGEIVSHHEFYDYEAKYSSGLADIQIPAPLSVEQTRSVQDMARRAFVVVDASGLARVDAFIRRDNGEVLINEINTMPGFTETSMYPKLWEASGVSYPELVDRLIVLAIERHEQRMDRSTEK